MKLDWLEDLLADLRKYRVQADAIETIVHHGDLTQPAILPDDVQVFSDEQMMKLQVYKDASVACQNYEDFINLIEKVVNEMGLNLMKDSSRVAAILNTFRDSPL